VIAAEAGAGARERRAIVMSVARRRAGAILGVVVPWAR
jgi:hypothetical protein